MILRQHVQHIKDANESNPMPSFRKASFLKFATLPRDCKWHISKLTTLARAPYQPHAENYLDDDAPLDLGTDSFIFAAFTTWFLQNLILVQQTPNLGQRLRHCFAVCHPFPVTIKRVIGWERTNATHLHPICQAHSYLRRNANTPCVINPWLTFAKAQVR